MISYGDTLKTYMKKTYMGLSLKGRLVLCYFVGVLFFSLSLFILVTTFPDANVFNLSVISAGIVTALGGTVVVYLTNYQVPIGEVTQAVKSITDKKAEYEAKKYIDQEINATTQQFSSTIQEMSWGSQDLRESVKVFAVDKKGSVY